MLKQISLAALQGSLISKYSQLRETKERATTNKLRSLPATSHHPVYNQHAAIQATLLKKRDYFANAHCRRGRSSALKQQTTYQISVLKVKRQLLESPRFPLRWSERVSRTKCLRATMPISFFLRNLFPVLNNSPAPKLKARPTYLHFHLAALACE